MNPYSDLMTGKEPLTVLGQTPGRMTELIRQIGTNGLDRSYAPGKWNVRQIIAHLAQCEMMFGTRFRQAVIIADYVVQPFDQDQWLRREPVTREGRELNAFLAMREWNLVFWHSLSAAEMERPMNHPERGAMTVRVLLETMAGHDLNHLAQLETIAADK